MPQTAPLKSAATGAPIPTAGHCWPVSLQKTLKHSKAGLAQSLVGVTVLFPGSWCTQSFVCALWASLVGLRFDSKHDFTPIILLGLLLWPRMWDMFFFVVFFVFFFCGINILLSMVVQHLVAILVFSQEKMSARPSTPPFFFLTFLSGATVLQFNFHLFLQPSLIFFLREHSN